MDLQPLVLKKGEERRVRAGHHWVFSNEVDTGKSPLSGFSAGEPAQILDYRHQPLGCGYVNPNALICARLTSRRVDEPLDQALLEQRIARALALRQQVFSRPFYRLVYGDSDALSGLVVDRYDQTLVVQITTAGMEALKDAIIAALEQVIQPETILLRNDTSSRNLEGLALYKEYVRGQQDPIVTLEENGVPFFADIYNGQKTGWFYDHRLNRERMSRYVSEQRVLDLFSYVGGWGIQAAVAGAKSVLCIDDSRSALELVDRNAALNAVTDRVSSEKSDAFSALKTLYSEEARFDVIIIDPPAFIQRKKDVKTGIEAYRRINQLAMRVLASPGILISASCSARLQYDVLKELLHKASRQGERSLQILEQGHQGPDHPIHPAMPETEYLKSVICRVG